MKISLLCLIYCYIKVLRLFCIRKTMEWIVELTWLPLKHTPVVISDSCTEEHSSWAGRWIEKSNNFCSLLKKTFMDTKFVFWQTVHFIVPLHCYSSLYDLKNIFKDYIEQGSTNLCIECCNFGIFALECCFLIEHYR